MVNVVNGNWIQCDEMAIYLFLRVKKREWCKIQCDLHLTAPGIPCRGRANNLGLSIKPDVASQPIVMKGMRHGHSAPWICLQQSVDEVFR